MLFKDAQCGRLSHPGSRAAVILPMNRFFGIGPGRSLQFPGTVMATPRVNRHPFVLYVMLARGQDVARMRA